MIRFFVGEKTAPLLEEATRRMNGRDPWNFVKELKTLTDSGVGEQKGGAHSLFTRFHTAITRL